MTTRQRQAPVIRTPIRVRFVGGPWHNLLPEITTLTSVAITADGQHRYHLAEYETPDFGTIYYQYIHFSLINNGRVKASTCLERLPCFIIDSRQLERKLAGKLPIKPRLRW